MAAIWSIEVQDDGRFRVTHLPLDRAREPFCCGCASPCTAASLVLDWVMSEAEPGDLIRDRGQGLMLFVLGPAQG